MSVNLTDDKSTLVQVMAWHHQVTSHYVSQCWASSVLPYCITKPQSVNALRPSDMCVGNLTIIASDNGLSPGRCQSITWSNADLLSIRPLGTNFNEILIGNMEIFICKNAFENVICEMAANLSQPQWVNQGDFSRQQPGSCLTEAVHQCHHPFNSSPPSAA